MSSGSFLFSTQLIRIWYQLSARRRSQVVLLLALMVLASIAEIISIGAVLPFLAVLMSPDKVTSNPLFAYVLKIGNLKHPRDMLLALTSLFCAASLVSSSIRLLLSWANIRYAFGVGIDLSLEIYRRTLYQPYSVHISRNSSEVIAGITTKVNSIIFSGILPTLLLITSCILMVAILATLVTIDAGMTFLVLLCFGGFYALVISFTRKRMVANGRTIANESAQVIKALQEGLGGIRDVLLDGSQNTYCDIYRASELPLRKAQGVNQFIAQSPRFIVESFGIIMIAMMAYILSQQPAGISSGFPVLGALAIGAQRLLPLMQQAYAAWVSVHSNKANFEDTLNLLEQPLPTHAKLPAADTIPFAHQIRFENVSFRYNDRHQWILKELNFSLSKGARLGIVGQTGSGKSTFIDIFMGLLSPAEGELKVDGQRIDERTLRSWQSLIAHVPQTIFMADTTIEENIAFGIPVHLIDHGRVVDAARKAQIVGDIESWPEGYATRVGERGVRLSGGQMQRIGIARALYKNAKVIVFDEATSALDNHTETAVMEAIDGLANDLTVVIIAHRLTTLRNCTEILELKGPGESRILSYQELINTK